MLLLILVVAVAGIAALVVWIMRRGGPPLDWQGIKEKALRWYEKAAALLLFQNMVGYLIACMSAGYPVTVGGYMSFLDHVFNAWRH